MVASKEERRRVERNVDESHTPLLYLNPEILDEMLKYSYLPKD